MIFITGYHASGKTYFANFLQKFGFLYLDCGPTIRNSWKSEMPNISFPNYLKLKEKEYGSHFTDELIVAAINKRLTDEPQIGRNLLIIGSRSFQGIEYIRKKIRVLNGESSHIVYIKACEKKLYQRYQKREGITLSEEDFHKTLERDKKMGIDGIYYRADFVIENNGSISQFEDAILDLVFRKIGIEKLQGGSPER